MVAVFRNSGLSQEYRKGADHLILGKNSTSFDNTMFRGLLQDISSTSTPDNDPQYADFFSVTEMQECVNSPVYKLSAAFIAGKLPYFHQSFFTVLETLRELEDEYKEKAEDETNSRPTRKKYYTLKNTIYSIIQKLRYIRHKKVGCFPSFVLDLQNKVVRLYPNIPLNVGQNDYETRSRLGNQFQPFAEYQKLYSNLSTTQLWYLESWGAVEIHHSSALKITALKSVTILGQLLFYKRTNTKMYDNFVQYKLRKRKFIKLGTFFKLFLTQADIAFPEQITKDCVDKLLINTPSLGHVKPIPITNPRLLFGTTPEQIVDIYERGPQSCMKSTSGDAQWRWLWQGDKNYHPVQWYGYHPQIGIAAYLTEKKDKVSARALIYKKNENDTKFSYYGRIYCSSGAASAKLERLLKSRGLSLYNEDDCLRLTACFTIPVRHFSKVDHVNAKAEGSNVFIPHPYTDNIHPQYNVAYKTKAKTALLVPTGLKTDKLKPYKKSEIKTVDFRTVKGYVSLGTDTRKKCSICGEFKTTRLRAPWHSVSFAVQFCSNSCLHRSSYCQALTSNGRLVYRYKTDSIRDKTDAFCYFTNQRSAIINGCLPLVDLDYCHKNSAYVVMANHLKRNKFSYLQYIFKEAKSWMLAKNASKISSSVCYMYFGQFLLPIIPTPESYNKLTLKQPDCVLVKNHNHCILCDRDTIDPYPNTTINERLSKHLVEWRNISV